MCIAAPSRYGVPLMAILSDDGKGFATYQPPWPLGGILFQELGKDGFRGLLLSRTWEEELQLRAIGL
jgi:hypothetical protein